MRIRARKTAAKRHEFHSPSVGIIDHSLALELAEGDLLDLAIDDGVSLEGRGGLLDLQEHRRAVTYEETQTLQRKNKIPVSTPGRIMPTKTWSNG